MTSGDIVLTPRFTISKEELRTLVGHEVRHRAQWAVVTVIGGPFAFPVAYAIDEFFFSRSRNHLERLAGLESGGYSHVGAGPVLGSAQLATLGVLAASIVGACSPYGIAVLHEISQPTPIHQVRVRIRA